MAFNAHDAMLRLRQLRLELSFLRFKETDNRPRGRDASRRVRAPAGGRHRRRDEPRGPLPDIWEPFFTTKEQGKDGPRAGHLLRRGEPERRLVLSESKRAWDA